MRLVTPVEVSLWTTITARVSGSSASAIRSGSAPWRQSPSSHTTSRPSLVGHRPPERREVPGLGRDHLVAGRERVDQRGLPCARAGRGIDDHRAVGAKDLRRPSSTSRPELREVRTAVVDGGRVDRPQHPVGDVRGAGDLEEVTAGCDTPDVSHPSERAIFVIMEELATALERELAGDVRADAYTRHLYAADASMFAVEPLAVAFPRDADDVAAAVSVAARLGVPIVPRGGGTSLAGQTAGGRGLVLDLSRHMDAIGEVDAGARRVRVEPGVVQERLNQRRQALRARVRAGHVDVEPGDARRDDRQQLLGQRVDRLRHDDRSRRRAGGRARATARAPRSRRTRARAAPSSGGSTAASRRSCATTRGRSPRTTRSTGASRAATGSTAWTRSTSSKLIVGSEGTLAIVTGATVRLVELPKAKMFAVGHFDTLLGAIDATARRARARSRRRSR